MQVDVLENIVKQLADNKGNFVDEKLDLIYTGHYNEILLYEHFEEMLKIFKKYNFSTAIFTNGVGLTKNKINIIKKYQDAIAGILMNIPSYEKESWSEMTKFNEGIFDKMLENIEYAFQELPEMAKENRIQLVVNGIDNNSLPENGGTMKPLENMPKVNMDVDSGHLATTKKFFQEKYPQLFVYTNNSLIDRAGYLRREKVMSNRPIILDINKREKKKVVGCRDASGRTTSWIHVNANADLFMCCDDYNFDTIYANLEEKSLEDIWHSSERQEAIEKTYNTLCVNCINAIWE